MNKFYYYYYYYYYYFIMSSCVGAPFDMKTQFKSKHVEEKITGVLLETT